MAAYVCEPAQAGLRPGAPAKAAGRAARARNAAGLAGADVFFARGKEGGGGGHAGVGAGLRLPRDAARADRGLGRAAGRAGGHGDVLAMSAQRSRPALLLPSPRPLLPSISSLR